MNLLSPRIALGLDGAAPISAIPDLSEIAASDGASLRDPTVGASRVERGIGPARDWLHVDRLVHVAGGEDFDVFGAPHAVAPGDDARIAPMELIGQRGTPGIGVTAIAPTHNQSIDGELIGVKWNSASITYSNPDSVSDYQPGYPIGDLKNFATVGALQMTAIRAALDTDLTYSPGRPGRAAFAVEGFTNLDIGYAGQGSGAGTLRLANNTNSNTAYAYYPDATNTGGDVWFGPSGGSPMVGNYDYSIVLHEIGHALGLKHGHEAGGFGPLPFDTDSMEYSVMTYRSYVGGPVTGYTNEEWGYAQTYMMNDIAALQHLYGADFSTNSGDTEYSWSAETGATYVNGKMAILPGGNRIFQTIWDGGGIDTYNLSDRTTDLDIDLNPGSQSTFSRAQLAYLGSHAPNGGFARGNVFNALQYHGDTRSLIENAFGGTGDDHILGNAAANWLVGNNGNDDLTGFAGDDRLDGGVGNDRLDGHVGADTMIGGYGDDIYFIYFVDNAGDLVIEALDVAAGGVDTVFSYISHDLDFGVENLTLIGSGTLGAIGNRLANQIQGNNSANVLGGEGGDDVLTGLDGNDFLFGADVRDTLIGGGGSDTLGGGAGNDILRGGEMSDRLMGGGGADVFDFDKATHSQPGARDVIVEEKGGAPAFEKAGHKGGDRIDVSTIDADFTHAGNQTFVFGGKGIGHIFAVNEGTDTCIRANCDADAAFEFELIIQDGNVLASAYNAQDFIL